MVGFFVGFGMGKPDGERLCHGALGADPSIVGWYVGFLDGFWVGVRMLDEVGDPVGRKEGATELRFNWFMTDWFDGWFACCCKDSLLLPDISSFCPPVLTLSSKQGPILFHALNQYSLSIPSSSSVTGKNSDCPQ